VQPAARAAGSVFDGVMGLFSRKRREAFDLAELGLRMPPFGSTTFPYRSSTQDLNRLWEICQLGAVWCNSLAPARRDFATAVDAYIAAEPPL
jgi:hypothetical protein